MKFGKFFGPGAALAMIGAIAAAFATVGAAGAADVNVTSNVTTGINLDTFAGSTVDVFPGVTVSNTAASAVSATVNAWTLTNRGSVSSTLSDTVSLSVTGSSVINFSSITGDSGSNGINLANGGSVDNRAGATISAGLSAVTIGTFGSPGAGTVTNAGTITQTAGFADTLELLSGGTVINLQGGIISGQNGGNAVSVGQGNSRTVINSGSIVNSGTGFATGVLVQGGASTVTNNLTGRISGTFNGVFSSSDGPLTLTNNGLIQSTGSDASARAVEADAGGTVVNTGIIKSASSDGLFLGDASTVTNSGTITGKSLAINFSNSATNTLTLDAGSVLNGNVQGGTGVNNLVLLGTGTEDISKFLSFQTLSMQGIVWTLTGTGTFSTSATIASGTLLVNGQLASPLVTVQSGGTLGGVGTIVGATTVASGGTLAPGNGGSVFGPLTVQGSLTFAAASTYLIQASPASASLTKVLGTATLGGATVNAVFQPGSYVDRQYTILTATGGRMGAFNPTVLSSSPNIQSTLSYDANDVFLNIHINFQTPIGPLSVNQQEVANTLTNYFNTNGGIPSAFAMLSPAGLTIASGELGTGIIQSAIKADDLFLNLLLDPTVVGRAGGFVAGTGAMRFADEDGDEAQAYAAQRRGAAGGREAYAMVSKAPMLNPQPTERWSVWTAAYGGSAKTGGNAFVGSQDTSYRTAGIAVGADTKVTQDTLVGFAFAGGGNSFSLANGLGSGSADLFQAGAYARHNFGPAYISAALAYGGHDVTTNRMVTLGGFDQLQGRFRADTYSGRLEGGYRFATPYMGLTPYGALQVISVRLPNYAEQSLVSNGQFALAYAGQTTIDTRGELGVRSDKSFALADGMLMLRGRAAWAHDYNPDRAVSAVFETLPGANFVVNGARPAPDSALVSATAERKWRDGFALSGTFEGEFSGNTASYAGKAVARYTW